MSDITRKFHAYRASLVVVPLVLVGVLALVGWLVWDATAGTKGSGTQSSETLTELADQSATGVRITGEFDATVIFVGFGQPTAVRVTSDDNMHQFIEVEQRDRLVDVRFSESVRPSERPRVSISLPEVTRIGAEAGASITAALGGSDALEVAVDGGSTVNMSGPVTELTLRAGGNSRVDLSPASVLKADVTIASTTEVIFGAVGRVDGTVRQASTVVVPELTLVDGLGTDETSEVVRR